MYFYPHHIGDYRSHTAHLSNEEDLAYRRLLDMYYDTERPIPLDTQWVARRIRVGIEVVSSVLADFFTRTDEGWRSARCDREIVAYHERAETARSNGKKGGRPKTQPEPTGLSAGSHPDAKANPDATGLKANQEPLAINPITPNGVKPARVRAPTVSQPEGVTDQTWADWNLLRKTKKAPVTDTVVMKAAEEASKAGLSLEDFLQVWCARGSQGLQADWLRPEERSRARRPSTHAFAGDVDYHEGVSEDGTFG